MSTKDAKPAAPYPFVGRVTLALLLVSVAVLLGAVLWTMTRMVLLVLLGVVFATYFHGSAMRIQAWRGWDYRFCAALVVLASVGAVGAIGGTVGPSIAHQITQMRTTLPEALADIEARVSSVPSGARFVQALPTTESLWASGFAQVSGMSQWLGGALDVASGVGFCVALAVFLMIEPARYRRGLLLLIPPLHRDRADEIVGELGTQLYGWTRARFAAMLFVGVFTGLGLWLAGVPMALALGAITGLLTFIPFVGPIVAAVPGLAIALAQGPIVAGIALAIYVAAQMIEGFLVTPWLQDQMAELPAAMLILGQFFFGAVGGISGLVVAGPATLVLRILVQKVYVEGLIRDDDRESGEREAGEHESGEHESGEHESGEQQPGEQETGPDAASGT